MGLKDYIWFFKKGRNELNFIIGMFNLITLLSIKFDLPLISNLSFLLTVLLVTVVIVIGMVSLENVESDYFRIVKFHNDDTKAQILLYSSLIEIINGNPDTAYQLLNEAIDHKRNWE